MADEAATATLALQSAMRKALNAFLPGDTVESEGRLAKLTQLHEDRTASVSSGANAARPLIRDLELRRSAAAGFPRMRTTHGTLELLRWTGKTIVDSTGVCFVNGRRSGHDNREGVHFQKLVATSQPLPEGIRIVRISLTVEGMDQGWGNSGDSGVNVSILPGVVQNGSDGAVLVGVVFDRRRQRHRRHVVDVQCAAHAAPMPGDRLQVWLRCPDYPGWRAECETVIISVAYVREEEVQTLGTPSPSVLESVGGVGALRMLGLTETPDTPEDEESHEAAAAAASFKLLWDRLADDAFLQLDASHLSLSGLKRQNILRDPKQPSGETQARIPPAVPRVHALIRKVGRPFELGGAIHLVERLEKNDAAAGAPNDLQARSTRYGQLLCSISKTLDRLETPDGQQHAEAVLESYASASKECIYRWEREIQMSHDLACGETTSLDSQHLEDILLRRLHARRRQIAEAALHRAKGTEANGDMHFDSYFYANLHFGVLEQRDAMLDPNRLTYAALGANLDFERINGELRREYSASTIRAILREEIAETTKEGAEVLRGKLFDWLRAAMPDGFRPGGERQQRQEEFLFEKCCDDAYKLTDAALNFVLVRMHVLSAAGVCDLFHAPAEATAADDEADESAAEGARVRLQNLAARPELNGREGVIRRRGAGGRLEVALDADAAGDEQTVAVRPANVRRVSAPERPAEQGGCIVC
eukprot:TRINITY_DN36927_c0_g1_i1.p1 TRINITY_DN36927_c0_g1~~TRINITY_DN36927_c0_g1_i1.p1  ORF type:complete len:725 (+),score=145.64 TRINITY_DN36927_c0_g1_i1:64-2175(+)